MELDPADVNGSHVVSTTIHACNMPSNNFTENVSSVSPPVLNQDFVVSAGPIEGFPEGDTKEAQGIAEIQGPGTTGALSLRFSGCETAGFCF